MVFESMTLFGISAIMLCLLVQVMPDKKEEEKQELRIGSIVKPDNEITYLDWCLKHNLKPFEKN